MLFSKYVGNYFAMRVIFKKYYKIDLYKNPTDKQ